MICNKYNKLSEHDTMKVHGLTTNLLFFVKSLGGCQHIF